ncbi:TetR/AcrR family transcriptional regulator [Microbulbifer agarilyticus]|uniref:TetR/AcrR family transcriptional regulator n=1 Tax=Microbulbifer agarilyticus TaxID=260552 RepID=UPI001CD7DE68|nr:TetR/AcrR family transcriptional regulator [Microbulbifer agarilyticus]MCA0894649.1 TetR/AcrR family transcriptional regulator [Microbulbifer agarilyticus]
MEKKVSRSELKRQAILDAAKRVFQERGVQSTSMDELAAQAEVSKRTVYNHFASKEILIMTLIGELWQQATQASEGDYDPTAEMQQQLCDLIEAEIAVICSKEYIELSRVAFDHFFHRTEALREQMDKFSAFETGIQRWIKAAVADGRLRELDPEIASQQIHNLIKGNCFWPQLLQIQPTLDSRERHELASNTAAMFLSHYRA